MEKGGYLDQQEKICIKQREKKTEERNNQILKYCHDHANGVATNTVVEVTLGKTIVKLTLFNTKASKMIVRHCG